MPIFGRLTPSAYGTLETQTHFLARCYRITARTPNGNVIGRVRLTDHPREIELTIDPDDAPETFLPTGAPEATARRSEMDLKGETREIRGAIQPTTAGVSLAWIKLGLFRRARVEEFLVDYRTPFQGPVRTDHYIIRSVPRRTGYEYQFEMTGLVAALEIPVTKPTGPLCTVELFSQGFGQCNASSSGFTETCEITAIVDRRTFTVDATDRSDGFWDGGKLYFNTSGSDNAFTTHEIKTSTGTGAKTLELAQPTGLPVSIGDNVQIWSGCNKGAGIGNWQTGTQDLEGHCKNRYDNLVNFQGDPHVPGLDRSVRGLLGL
ncbi:MAG: DUF2163 domain-containing protein [Planctomycetota bacterium]